MSCSRYENDIALYAGGDLPEEAVSGVEEHLGTCPDCRELLAGLRADMETQRDEPISELALARMRAKVMERVAAPKRARGWWWFAPVPLAAAALVWMLIEPPPVPPPPVARLFLPPVPVAPKVVARVGIRPAPQKRKPARPEFKAEPLLVKLQTDDPNVVIYWIVEKGED